MPDNPFGITQVDIPGIYGAVNSLRSSRIQQMLGQQQLQHAQWQAEQDNNIRGILARAYGGAQASQATASATSSPSTSTSGGTPSPPTMPVPAPPTTGATPAVTPQGLPGANPAGSSPSLRVSPEIAQQLLAAGADGAQMLHTINAAGDEQLTAMQHRLQALAPLYANASHIPYGTDGSARRAYIRSVLPEIQQLGIDPQQAMGWDPTDQNLNAHMSFGQTTNDALESARGHPMAGTQGGAIVDPDNIDPVTGRARVLWESPTVNGPGGEPFARPSNMSQMAPTEQSLRAQAAEAIRLGAPPAQVNARLEASLRALQGGAPQPEAAGTFRQDGGAFDFRANPPPGG